MPPLFSRNVRGILTLVEKREAFNDLTVTKESEKLIIKLLFTSRRPPERSHADLANNAHRLLKRTLVEGRQRSGQPSMERARN